MDNSLEPLLDHISKEGGEDLTIKEKDATYLITSSKNQKKNKNNDVSTIILGDCENILNEVYNISNNYSILISKIDYYEEGSLVPIVLYSMYHPITKQKLDLNYCKDTKISLSIPALLLKKMNYLNIIHQVNFIQI